MVKEERWTKIAYGYGSRSSDNEHFIRIKPECDCNSLTPSWKHKIKENNINSIELSKNKAVFHEELHELKEQIECFIDKNQKTNQKEIEKKFQLFPKKIISEILDWITRKEKNSLWIKLMTEKLFKKLTKS